MAINLEASAPRTPELVRDGHGGLEALRPGTIAGTVVVDRARVHVSLDGFDVEEAEAHHGAVCVVGVRDAAALLLLCDRWMVRARRVWAAAVDDGAAPDLGRRSGVARALLADGSVGDDEVDGTAGRFRLYRADGDGALAPVAEVRRVRGGEPHSATLPRQLGVLRPAVEGPLPAWTASHPLFPLAATRYGPDAPSVVPGLLRAWAARGLMLATASEGKCRFREGGVTDPVRAFGWADVPSGRVGAMPVVSSLLELRLYALEHLADGRLAGDAPPAPAEVDLLAEASELPGMGAVVSAMRGLGEGVTAVETRGRGLFVFEARGRRTRSFLRDKALAELLLMVAWDALDGDATSHRAAEAPELACDYLSYASRPELRRVVARETAAGRAAPLRLVARKTELWGMSVWVGDVNGSA